MYNSFKEVEGKTHEVKKESEQSSFQGTGDQDCGLQSADVAGCFVIQWQRDCYLLCKAARAHIYQYLLETIFVFFSPSLLPPPL